MDPVTIHTHFIILMPYPVAKNLIHFVAVKEFIHFLWLLRIPLPQPNYILLTDGVLTRGAQLAQLCVQADLSTQQRQSFLVGLSSKKEILRVQNSENIVSMKRTGKSTI